MKCRPNPAVVAYVTKSNKEQNYSLEDRYRMAHDLPQAEVKTFRFRRYREHILVIGLITTILIGSFYLYGAG